jgi:hypothetical protein
VAIPSISNLESVLYVPTVTATSPSQPKALAQRTSFETNIAPSRSRELTTFALAKGEIIQELINGLETLINAAQKTNLPTDFPNQSRVSLQADIDVILKNIDDIANSAEIGSISLLRADQRNIYLETTELGGRIQATGLAIDTNSLGLSSLNILTDLGIKDATNRIASASFTVNQRLERLNQLNEAINNQFDYGNLSSSSSSSLSNNLAETIANDSTGYNIPIAYSNPVTGQYDAQNYSNGSFVNLIG